MTGPWLLGARGLVSADPFGNDNAVVAQQTRDLLDEHAGVGQQRHEAGPQLSEDQARRRTGHQAAGSGGYLLTPSGPAKSLARIVGMSNRGLTRTLDGSRGTTTRIENARRGAESSRGAQS